MGSENGLCIGNEHQEQVVGFDSRMVASLSQRAGEGGRSIWNITASILSEASLNSPAEEPVPVNTGFKIQLPTKRERKMASSELLGVTMAQEQNSCVLSGV